MGLKPAYQVIANGKDITDKISAGLDSITITDNAGTDSDSVEIVIIDDGKIAMPPSGAVLHIYAGYDPKPAYFGEYIVDEVSPDYPPHTLTIRAKAADMASSIKAARSYNWLPPGPLPGGQIAFLSIVNNIAARHSLKPVFGDTLKSVFFDAINQTEESDINLLTRLAKDNGAVAKVANGYLIVVPKGEAKSATQKSMPTATITMDSNVVSYNATISKRNAYGSVSAKYQDIDGAEIKTVTAGSGDPSHTLRATHKTKEQATAKAEAEKKASQRGEVDLEMELLGREDLKAEGKIILAGFRDGLNNTYTIQEATHTVSGSGYTTKIKAAIKAE